MPKAARTTTASQPLHTVEDAPASDTDKQLAGQPPRVDAAMLDGTEEPSEEPKGTTAPAAAPKGSGTARKAATGKTAARPLFGSLVEQKEYLRYLIWGREGSGKTTAALTASSRGKVLVINAEGGLKRKALEGFGVVAENVSLYPQPGDPITHAGLDEVFRQVKADLASDPDAWFAVIFDSATDIVTGMVGAAGDDRVKKARNRGQNIDEFDQWFTDRGDYGVASKMFRDLLRKYRTLDCHLIVTALERRDVDDDTSEVTYGPAVNAAIANDLAGYVDVIARATAATEDRPFRALTRKDDRYRTKDRFHVLPPVLVDPFATRVLDYIEGTLTEANDEKQKALPAEAAKATGKIRKATAAKPAEGDAKG